MMSNSPPTVTGLRGSQAGHMPSNLLDGPRTAQCGQQAFRANRSPTLVNGALRTMIATSGQRSLR